MFYGVGDNANGDVHGGLRATEGISLIELKMHLVNLWKTKGRDEGITLRQVHLARAGQ
jgi:hypothetical protein